LELELVRYALATATSSILLIWLQSQLLPPLSSMGRSFSLFFLQPHDSSFSNSSDSRRLIVIISLSSGQFLRMLLAAILRFVMLLQCPHVWLIVLSFTSSGAAAPHSSGASPALCSPL
jgi:hypothetical protein